jgi:hypothetical protein
MLVPVPPSRTLLELVAIVVATGLLILLTIVWRYQPLFPTLASALTKCRTYLAELPSDNNWSDTLSLLRKTTVLLTDTACKSHARLDMFRLGSAQKSWQELLTVQMEFNQAAIAFVDRLLSTSHNLSSAPLAAHFDSYASEVRLLISVANDGISGLLASIIHLQTRFAIYLAVFAILTTIVVALWTASA